VLEVAKEVQAHKQTALKYAHACINVCGPDKPVCTMFYKVVFCLTLVCAVHCSKPCKDLARQICACETTQAAKSACNDRADQEAKNYKVSKTTENICASLKDSCTCEKLASGDLAACGLSGPEQTE
jgi:hypothetical protein